MDLTNWGGHNFGNSLGDAHVTPKKRAVSQPGVRKIKPTRDRSDTADVESDGPDPIDMLSSPLRPSPESERPAKSSKSRRNMRNQSEEDVIQPQPQPQPKSKPKKASALGNPYDRALKSGKSKPARQDSAPSQCSKASTQSQLKNQMESVDLDSTPKPARFTKNDNAFRSKAASRSKATNPDASNDELSDYSHTMGEDSPLRAQVNSLRPSKQQPEIKRFPVSPPRRQRRSAQDDKLKPEPFPMTLDRKKPTQRQDIESFPMDLTKPRPRSRPHAKKDTNGSRPEQIATSGRRESFGIGPDLSPLRPELRKKAYEPFPMEVPQKAVALQKSSPKRAADDLLTSSRSSKRRKSSPVDDEDDMSSPERVHVKKPNVDHSKLCPFCDQPLPEQLSPEFHDLLRNAIKRAVNRPRPSNRFGLKASLPIYIGVCERHRFEEKLLPQAIKAGWPTTIDFNAVPRRLLDQRKLLKDILQNPSTSSFFRDSLEHVQAVGLRVAESAMGQYATFERIQPGYYGERGSIVIHQTLFTMFSPEVMLAAQPNFAPLSQHTFTHAVLVPEAALLLIQQDQRTPREAALKTMRASSRFGALMFPDDDDEEMAGGAADELMRERAQRRRKEIEEEERLEREDLALENARRLKNGEAPLDLDMGWSVPSSSKPKAPTASSKAQAPASSSSSVAGGSKPKVTVKTKVAKSKPDAEVVEISDSDASVASRKRKVPARRKVTSSMSATDASDGDFKMLDVTPVKKRAVVSKTVAKPVRSAAPSDAELSTASRSSARLGAKAKGKGRDEASKMIVAMSESDADMSCGLRASTRSATQTKGTARAAASSKAAADKVGAASAPIDLTSDAETNSDTRRRIEASATHAIRRPGVHWSSSTSSSSDSGSDDDISQSTQALLQHRDPPPRSSQLLLSSQMRSPSPSENRNYHPVAQRKANPQKAPAKTTSIQPTLSGLTTPKPATRVKKLRTGSSLTENEVGEATPRAPLGQRSTNGQVSQPYQPSRGDNWLLSSPDKSQSSQPSKAPEYIPNEQDFNDMENHSTDSEI